MQLGKVTNEFLYLWCLGYFEIDKTEIVIPKLYIDRIDFWSLRVAAFPRVQKELEHHCNLLIVL